MSHRKDKRVRLMRHRLQGGAEQHRGGGAKCECATRDPMCGGPALGSPFCPAWLSCADTWSRDAAALMAVMLASTTLPADAVRSKPMGLDPGPRTQRSRAATPAASRPSMRHSARAAATSARRVWVAEESAPVVAMTLRSTSAGSA